MEIDNRVSGKTRFMGIIGNPIGHSISPQLHNSISRLLGIDCIYVPFKVEKESLEAAVKGLKALNVLGFNVTVPYKRDVMDFLDEITPEARLMGAVNTVKNTGSGLCGHNTDAEGFCRSFMEESGIGFKGRNVVLIGAGGAARAIAVKVAMEGAASVSIINRTASKAGDIVEVLSNYAGCNALGCGFEDESARKVFSKGDIIINTTSVGMHPNTGESPIDGFAEFSPEQVVYDVIYNPARTKFLEGAEKKGCKTVNGLGMLFYQGIYAYEIWTGARLPEDVTGEIYRAFTEVLKKK